MLKDIHEETVQKPQIKESKLHKLEKYVTRRVLTTKGNLPAQASARWHDRSDKNLNHEECEHEWSDLREKRPSEAKIKLEEEKVKQKTEQRKKYLFFYKVVCRWKKKY